MADFCFDIVLFDLDGTLVDSHRDLAPAVNHTLRLAGREELPAQRVRGFIGGGTRMMLERALEATGGPLEAARLEELNEALVAYYWAHIADSTVAFAGVVAALDRLADAGCRLAVCTNKAERPARRLLEALGLAPRFAALYGGDTLGPGRAKPQPDMLLAAIEACGAGRAAMVGDSSFDVLAARAAGLPVIVYAQGYLDRPAADMGSDALIDHFDELVPTLERLGGRARPPLPCA